MNKWKVFAVIFALISFGAIQETFRILKSNDLDIANNRPELIPMAIILTGLCIIATITFWIKANNRNT